MTNFTVKVQPSKDNDYTYSSWEYSKEYVLKEIELEKIDTLSLEDVILDVTPGDIAVYQQEVVTTLSWEKHYLKSDEIAVLEESKVNKLRRLAIRLVVVASALTTAIVGWDVAHPEKSVGELMYPSQHNVETLRENSFYMHCASAVECASSDAKAYAEIGKVKDKGNSYAAVEAAKELPNLICKQYGFEGYNLNAKCVAKINPIIDKVVDKYWETHNPNQY